MSAHLLPLFFPTIPDTFQGTGRPPKVVVKAKPPKGTAR